MMTHTRERQTALLAMLLAGRCMAKVATAIVNVAAPSIRAGLRASAGESPTGQGRPFSAGPPPNRT